MKSFAWICLPLVLLVTACPGEAPGLDERVEPVAPGLESIVLPPDDAWATPAEPGEASGPCDCPDEACVKAWTDSHLGCGLCISFVCEDGTGVHSCNPCP